MAMRKIGQPGPVALLTLGLAASAGPVTAGDTCPRPAPAEHQEALAAYEAGRDLILKEKWEEAASTLEAAVRLDGTIPLAHYGLGEARLALKRAPEALSAFLDSRAAYRCLLASPDALANMERLRQEEEGMLRAAIGGLEREYLVRSRITGKEVNRMEEPSHGEVQRRIHAMEIRLDELSRSRGRPPAEPPELAFALGNAYFQTGSFAEAEREFRAALAARPGWGDVHHNLAVVMVAAGRLEEAETEVKAARKAGVPVHPRLEKEIEKMRAARPSTPP
jgi:tetratricopeptide (TPR) repeat protein